MLTLFFNLSYVQVDVHGFQLRAYVHGHPLVANYRVDVVHRGDESQGAFVDFTRIENRYDLLCAGEHHLIYVGLFDIGRREPAFEVETVHSEEQFVAIEQPEIGFGYRPYGRLARLAQVAAEQDYVETFVLKHLDGHIYGVGQNGEPLKLVEVLGYFERGGARIEHYGIAVVDERGSRTSYGLFFAEVNEPLAVDVYVVVGGYGIRAHHGPAVSTYDEITFVESV